MLFGISITFNNMAKKHNRKLNFQVSPGFGSPIQPKPLIEGQSKYPIAVPRLRGNAARMDQSVAQEQAEFSKLKLRGNNVRNTAISTTPNRRSSTTRTSSTTTTPGPTSTSSFDTTIPETTSMPRRRNESRNSRGGTSYNEGAGRWKTTDGASVSVIGAENVSSEFNKPLDQRGSWVPDGIGKPIDYSYPVRSTLHVNVNEANLLPSSDAKLAAENLVKFEVNLSSYAERFGAMSNGSDQTSAEYKAIYNLYYKITEDIYRDARSSVVSNWTFVNFTKLLYWTAKGIELITAVESIISYAPIDGVSIPNVTKLRNAIQTQEVLQARFDLRQAMIGKVLPPRLSELIRWHYQTYRKGKSKYTTHYRYLPDSTMVGTEANMSANIKTAMMSVISNLGDSQLAACSASLTKIYPSWVISNIPGAYVDSVYDPHHLEMYYNESTMFEDPNNTNAASVVPASPTTGTVDIPYYTHEEPNNTNGFAFLLQSTWITNATGLSYPTGNDYKTNGGVRLLLAASPTSTTGYTRKTNKFYAGDSSGSILFTPRNIYSTYTDISTDCHKVLCPSGGTTVGWSSGPLGAIRIYNNNVSALQVNLVSFINYLFGLKA